MKSFTIRKRFLVSLVSVLCACVALFANFGLRSEAGSRVAALSGSIANTEPLGKIEDLVPANSVNLRYVSGPSVWSPLTSLAASQARPLSLANGDVNADGFADLICAYGTNDGGYLVIYYGDERAFSSSRPGVLENKFSAPFSHYLVIQLDHTPDFVYTGDFDRDSRRDILTASRNGLSLNVFLARENSFSRSEVSLPGPLSDSPR